ncbi:MAG TPA: hypothetical protein VHF89_12030 [Solirubrobacteraceae bacterium]|nr:hypothetical protein [Solirubrobacteraceae bacterium]
MARILIETDGGATTLSEKLVGVNLADDDYADKLVQRVGWAVSEAEAADAVGVRAVRSLSDVPSG